MAKRLREIIKERYPDDYEQKTVVGKSFVAMHRDAKKVDKLGDKGGTEGQFKADNVEVAPHERAPQDGFPADGEYNDFNLPTHYDSADGGEEDDDDYKYDFDPNDVDNDTTRSRIATADYDYGEETEQLDEETPNETKRGLAKWEKDYQKARKYGNLKLAKEIKKNIDKKKNEETQQSFLERLEEQSLTRKHFREVANTVRAIEDPKERQKFAEHHAAIFAKANPRFSFQKFHDACGTKAQLNDAPRKA